MNAPHHDFDLPGELTGQALRSWFAKLRPGGIVAGGDYSPDWPLIVVAIDDFICANGLELHKVDCRPEGGRPARPSWFAMKP